MSAPRKNEEMIEEYDFSQGEKGRYFARYKEGSNVVVLDPDVAEVFRDQRFVNESLRALAGVIKLKEKDEEKDEQERFINP